MGNRSRFSGDYDLLAILALTALLTICIAFIPSDIPRVVLGLPFLLFLPGYTLIAALFPRKGRLSSSERAALSLGLSLAVVALIGLFLNYAWEISLYPILTSTAVFVVAMCALSYLRRGQLAPEQRFVPPLVLRLPELRKQGRLDRALTAILAMAVIAVAATVVYAVAHPKPGERFTEFYLSGPDGISGDYPSEVVLGDDVRFVVGITNHEGADVTYEVRIAVDGDEVMAITGIQLGHGENWEDGVAFAPVKPGVDQRVELLLYRDGTSEPYHQLHLWLDVLNP